VKTVHRENSAHLIIVRQWADANNVAMLGKIAVLFQVSFDHLLDDEVEVDG
jgi:hypothetical protein